MSTQVAVLCPDLSNHVVGRSLVLAQVIDQVDGYGAKIIGPRVRGRKVHPVFKDSYLYDSLYGHINPFSAFTLSKLVKKVDAEIVYCTKPRLFSFGAGLLIKKTKGKKLILDIDDWDKGGYIESKQNEPIRAPIKNLLDPNGYFTHQWLRQHISEADVVTTVSSELQSIYKQDSYIIPHARSASRFNPDNYDVTRIKAQFGIRDRPVTGFIGSPAPNKGIKESLDAIESSEFSKEIVYLITDGGEGDYISDLTKNYNIDIRRIDPFGFQKLPKMLAMFDFMILHQNQRPTSRGQVPAKITDSLSMGIPTIVTDIYGLDQVVGDGALLVDVNDLSSISQYIDRILSDNEFSKKLSHKARAQFLSSLSIESASDKMESVLE
jgi:glycosyltransferase involved in cell wall biosynthesis